MSDQWVKAGIRIDRHENVTVAAFELTELSDVDEVGRILTRFKREIRDHRPQNVLIDFDGISYISTVGINMLLVVLKRVRTYGGQVYIVNACKVVRNLFNLMQLDQVFELVPDRQAAMEKIASRN